MDKQTINHPPRKHVTEDLKAELGIDLWWFTLAEDLGVLLNEAVSAGMPPEIAQEAYKDVVAKALPSAMSVKGKENKDKRIETESWVCMTCKSKFAIPKDRVDGQRCFRCEGPIMPVNTRARIYQELLREGDWQ
ncbi:hypothetical protein M5X06_28060 [Paenibacillus alvei]|uniref:Uncharacterized protein n=1 Tax=Paenibacillus alvei TaxID=44250 RepID=A0ABT4GQN5_PAEAL|nr:hypothetical protein [Paenibacillus alvei]MCY9758962.1 hypothetical protein [Paenibacillus alvei]MCY9770635.1 hypothetical protein [Paenibacillus alvei]